MSDNIIVAIRVRPFISRERNSSLCWTVEQSNQITQLNGDGKHLTAHVFDRVYDQVSSTEEVYNDTAAPIVEAAMHGFHGTLFAYGQTSSGKTHTMTGDKDCPGIVQLAVEDIFNTIENSPEREFLIRVSYLEIYQENVVDLLGNLAKHLDIKENYHGTVFVENLKENVATSVEEVMTEMKKAEVNRHIGATKMNERSSRSHTIFRVIIESHLRTEESVKSDDVDDAVMVAHLNFVDLAGSENAKQAGASGQRLAESGAINKSLFSLSLVIGQLSTGSTFVNYRNSRLTRILQNALGGNSKTAIICTISPASLDQSISTLRFATSAKSIKNKPVVNEVISGETMLKRYKKEIHELKKQLEEAKCASSHVRSDIGMSQSKEDKIELLTRLFCVSSQLGGATGTRRNARSEARRRETWCPGRGGVPLPPFLAARGATYPQPLLPPSMLPQNKDEPSSPEEPIKVASESTATHNSSPVKTAEKNVARNNNEAEKELTVARQRIVELESREAELVAAHDKELSRLQAQLELGKTEAENVHKSHLDEIACITQSRDEAAELAKAVKMQIIEVQTFGRDLISNYQQEIADLEARLESTKLEVEHMCKSHLEEIACLTQSRDEAAEQAKTAKMQIIEVQTFGKDLISKYQQEVADLEAELESAKLEAEHNCELHLEDITRLTKDCHEANEELEVARTQISEMQTMGREMIAKHHHQVALLEADLEAAREKQPCVSCERHLEEISRLTQSRDDAVEDLETARSEMAKMKAMGTEMIRNLQQQVAELEADLISTRETQESASSELHLANIARLKQDCHEADEELEAARTQISEMQTMGREMIAKHQHQVAILEAELKSTKKGSENHITRETYEKERQRLMQCCDEADDELEAAKRSQATWNREKEGLLAEVDQLKQTIARIQIKNTMLENELVQVQDPHIRRIKFFEQELNRVVTINKTLKNEIRDLHNKQSNESFLQPRQMKVSQKANEYAEGEKEFRLQVEIKRLSKKVEALQTALDAQGKNT